MQQPKASDENAIFIAEIVVLDFWVVLKYGI